MRQSGKILATVLREISDQLLPGMTGKDASAIARQELKAMGGKASFLGYGGFPDVICISINDEVVHGIPDSREFKTGDIIGFDFGVTYDGMITDSAVTRIVGNADKKIMQLVADTEAAMLAGVAVVRDGVRTGDIGAAVQKVLDAKSYGIVRDLVGHGVGHYVHEDPNVPNYGKTGTGERLEAGMTIAIEPMATLGTYKVQVDPDGWTIRTQDGSLSAHFEHTVLITQDGADILTTV